MNQELVAAQPCSPFSVVRDVVDDITFGDDAVFQLDGFCLFRVFIYPKPVRAPYEESLSYFSDTVDKGDLGAYLYTSLSFRFYKVKSLSGTEHDVPFMGFHDIRYGIERFGEVDVKLGERMSVETADTVERTYPHHVVAVFKDFIDGIVRQPVLVGKIVYRGCGFYWVKRQADEEESYKN